jgi:Ca-activated chloride channel family protein
MPESSFHFARPEWLFALLGLLPVLAWLVFSVVRPHKGPFYRYADKHLLPHLLGVRELDVNEHWSRFTRWGFLWTLLVVALAGPRWDFVDVEAFSPTSDLEILMDISRSMNVADTPPSRMARARQEIQDLVLQNNKLRIGMIAFASVPHVVAPITEDTQSILNALPAVSSDLARLQGSRLTAALERAEQLLGGSGDHARTILLISDGDFDEPDIGEKIEELKEKGVMLHTLGIGTMGGGPIPLQTDKSNLLRNPQGEVIISRLNETIMKQLAHLGGGIYQQANFRDLDSRRILELASGGISAPRRTQEKTQVWNERFYWFLLPMMMLLLPRFRGLFSEKPQP